MVEIGRYIVSLSKNKLMSIPIYRKIKIEDETLKNEFIDVFKNSDARIRGKIKFSYKKDMRKYIYYLKVHVIGEKNALQLDNIHLRGDGYILSHIIPISKGYENNIDPSIIGGLDNLRMIPSDEVFKSKL